MVAAVLILKNRAAEPLAGAESEPSATTAPGERWSAGPGELPGEQLERLLAAGQPTLAFFHSNNCVECTRMIKIVADVYPEFEDVVALVDVNVYDPQNRALMQQAKIQYIPTQIFYNAAGDGNLTVGAMPAQVFRRYMRAAAGQE
jgi:thiol:disulfide interchange protein